jgi:DNA-binding transcriptional LysR family regulator
MISARDLPLLPVYVAVATHGSFTAAAKTLGLAKSVVSQHIRTLEARCGVRLIERSTRQLHVTQVGEQVLEAAREVLASVRSLERVVENHRELPTGSLRVTLPHDPGFSAMVGPVVASMVRKYPSLKVELIFDDAIHDLVEAGLDVALRLGPVTESSYVVRRLGSEPEILVGSPAAVDALGALDRPISRQFDAQDPRWFDDAPWVVHSAQNLRATCTLRTETGAKAHVGVRVLVTTNTVVALRDLLLAGAGFGIIPRHAVHADLKDGRLVHLCPSWYSRRLALHAVLPTRHAPPRVRLFLDELMEAAGPVGISSRSRSAS